MVGGEGWRFRVWAEGNWPFYGLGCLRVEGGAIPVRANSSCASGG
jgi:hypothetical protein